MLPSQARIRTYAVLYSAGRFLYGSYKYGVQRLPFNVFIKFSNTSYGALANEYAALQLLREHTDLPVPRPLDFVSDLKRTYMITSRIPGYQMGDVFNLLSDEQMQSVAIDINRFLAKLRVIPKEVRPPTTPATAVTGAMGGRCHHVRMEAYTAYIFRGFGDFEHELAVERRLWERIF